MMHTEKFDFFMSIGSHCRPALYLRRWGLRQVSSPLDWMMRYRLETVLALFQTQFRTFFREIREVCDYEDSNGVLKKEKRRWVEDTCNCITAIHHFSSELPLANQYAGFIAKMEERYLETDRLLHTSADVALVGTWDNKWDELRRFLISFGALYPETSFSLIHIRNNEAVTGIRTRKERIGDRLKLTEYEFCDATDADGVNSAGKEHWDTIMGGLQLKKHPFIESIETLMKRNDIYIYIYIYGAGIYGAAVARLFTRYDIPIKAFLVTERSGNLDSILGIPVVCFSDIVDFRNTIVVIAISDEQANCEIAENLMKKGASHIVKYEETPFFYER